MVKHLCIILVCYLTVSGTTMLDAVLAEASSGILDRISAQSLTLGLAPFLIYLAVRYLHSFSSNGTLENRNQ